jgi:NADPH-dependent ferric siderophore reductase
MPYIPKWIADTMESVLPSKYFDAEVIGSEYITSEILKIKFAGNLHKIDFYPGQAVVIRAGMNDFRHYTICSFNSATGTFDIIFHIHGNAPGSNLAVLLKIGGKLKMAVPGGQKMYMPEKDFHFFFGDETSLSFILILIEEIQKNGRSYKGIIELRNLNSLVPDKLDMNVKTTLRTPDTPGIQAINYFNELKNTHDFSLEKYVFYLTGNVNSVQAFRKELKKLGISSQNIKFQGYWLEGKKGL